MCIAERIRGNGMHQYVTTHGLRAKIALLLLEVGHSHSLSALRTGHNYVESLKHYQNLQGREGYRQQRDLFVSELQDRGNEETDIYTVVHCPLQRGQAHDVVV
eukprot:IDg5304t1